MSIFTSVIRNKKKIKKDIFACKECKSDSIFNIQRKLLFSATKYFPASSVHLL